MAPPASPPLPLPSLFRLLPLLLVQLPRGLISLGPSSLPGPTSAADADDPPLRRLPPPPPPPPPPSPLPLPRLRALDTPRRSSIRRRRVVEYTLLGSAIGPSLAVELAFALTTEAEEAAALERDGADDADGEEWSDGRLLPPPRRRDGAGDAAGTAWFPLLQLGLRAPVLPLGETKLSCRRALSAGDAGDAAVADAVAALEGEAKDVPAPGGRGGRGAFAGLLGCFLPVAVVGGVRPCCPAIMTAK